jgi:cytochrome b subunit of formate dehydrogenase
LPAALDQCLMPGPGVVMFTKVISIFICAIHHNATLRHAQQWLLSDRRADTPA